MRSSLKLKLVDRITGNIADLVGYFSGWLVPVMMLLVLYEVFMRYVLNNPPIIADEFSAYMLVALTFLGAAHTWRHKGHVRITAMIDRLPPRIASWLRLITLILAFAFSVILAQSGYTYLSLSFRVNMRSITHYLVPLRWPQMPIAFGFALLSILILVEVAKTIAALRAGETVETFEKGGEESL